MSYREDFREGQSNAWWSLPRIVLALVAIVGIVYGIGFIATGGDLAIYSFWAPKQAQAENSVFHQTQAYTDGKIQYIGKLCFDEAQAEGNQKAALASEIRNEAATIHETKLPADEQACVDRAKGL